MQLETAVLVKFRSSCSCEQFSKLDRLLYLKGMCRIIQYMRSLRTIDMETPRVEMIPISSNQKSSRLRDTLRGGASPLSAHDRLDAVSDQVSTLEAERHAISAHTDGV